MKKEELEEMSELTLELFDGDFVEAHKWVLEPNDYFFGSSPYDVYVLGGGQQVISYLEERLGQ